jgi:hypothetical protein
MHRFVSDSPGFIAFLNSAAWSELCRDLVLPVSPDARNGRLAVRETTFSPMARFFALWHRLTFDIEIRREYSRQRPYPGHLEQRAWRTTSEGCGRSWQSQFAFQVQQRGKFVDLLRLHGNANRSNSFFDSLLPCEFRTLPQIVAHGSVK